MACHKSGADRCGADRCRPCAADPGRCAACATGARAESCREADGRSGRKSWILLLVRSSATLVQAAGDSTGGRAQIEQIVDVPVPQIWEQSVEVIKLILQEQCQRMRFFFLLTACGKGAVGGTFHTCCPQQAIVDSECKRWNVCCCFLAHPFYLCNCCVHLSSRFSPVPSLALRIGSNDQCDGNQCCFSFGGCLR